jgi:CxxC-x17-CxxC domain-containing protein
MVTFEKSRERKSRGSGPKRDNRAWKRFEGNSRGNDRRSSGRRDRGDVQMTKVVCSGCGNDCQVPFKPTSNKPVFCDECFAKKGDNKRSGSRGNSNKDFDIINEKLNKIMKALEIN